MPTLFSMPMALQASPPAPPMHVLRPRTGWRLPELGELWRCRELLGTLASRDLRLRYKQTVVGVAWVVLRPLVGALILAFVFGMVAGLQAPSGVPYFLFAFAGMVGWSAFSGTFDRASISLVVNAPLVTKVWFPRLLLPLSTALASIVDVAVVLLLLVVLAFAGGHVIGLPILLLPVFLALLLALALALGTLAAAVAVYYRDAQHLVPVVTQLLLYASPVAYPTSVVTERIGAPLSTLYHLNPLVGLLEAFRWSALGAGEVPWAWFGYAATVTAVLCVVAAMVFRRLESGFADVI